MKKLLFIACVASLAACNNAATTETKKDSASTATVVPDKKPLPSFPYTTAKPWANWQPGDPQHIVTVMNALKGYETGDIATCMKGFGDSVELHFDRFRATLSNDSLGKFFAADRSSYSAYKVYMADFESVISEDKKTAYVTLWYKQVTTDKKGKTDSISVVNDCKIANGKIVELDEKTQHYPAS
jgi:hypothetical protein